MKVIRQFQIAWMLVVFLMLQGFGQDIIKPVSIPPSPPPPLKTKITTESVSDENSSKPEPGLDLENLPPPPPTPNIAPPRPPPEIKPTPKSVSDENLSKTKDGVRTISIGGRTIAIPPRPPRPPQIMWFEFTYNSPEEKAFWDKLPDWPVRELKLPKKVNALGQSIDYNSTEGYAGYVKKRISSAKDYERIIYQFVDGFLLRKAAWNRQGQKIYEGYFKDGKVEGLSTNWRENGQKRFEKNYKDGKLDGLETRWGWLGNESQTNYKDGVKVED